MYYVGDKIIYGENGVCTIEKIGPLESGGLKNEKEYYHLSPLVGSGKVFSPVDSGAFMRPVINAEEANALIDSIPDIEPAICTDNRFNHVDAFYRELFKQHSNEVLVSVIKGLKIRMASKKSKSSRGRLERIAKAASPPMEPMGSFPCSAMGPRISSRSSRV